jgi:hypothetical protein
MLEEVLAEAEAAEGSELGPVDNDWAHQVLQEATKVWRAWHGRFAKAVW